MTPVLEEEPTKKPKRAKKPKPAKQAETTKKPALAKKSSTMQTAGVVIRDTLRVSVSKKKAQAKVDRGKGMDLLSDVALLEAAQLKKVLKKSKQDTHMLHASGSSDGVDETNDESKEFDEEEYEELYGDVNISLKDVEPAKKEKDNEEMIAKQKTEVPIPSSSISFDYAAKYLNFDNIPSVDTEVVFMLDINVQHEVLCTSPLLTILVSVIPEHTVDNPCEIVTAASITDLEKDVKELKTVDHSATLLSTIKSEVSNAVKEYLGTSLDDALYKVIKKHNVDIIKEHSVPPEIVQRLKQQYVPKKSTEDIIKIKMEHARKQQVPIQTITSSDTTALEEFDQKTTLFESMTKSKSFKKIPKQRALYHALMESILKDEDAMDEGSAGSDRGLKRQKTSKDIEPFYTTEETMFEAGDTQEPQNQGQDIRNTDDQPNVKAAPKHDCKITQAKKPPLSFDELMSTPIDFSAYVMNHLKIDNLTQQHLVGPAFNLLKGTCKSRVELEYNFEECYKAVTDRLDWNNPEGKEYTFDLSKPLPLIMERGCQVVPVDFFFNDDLEYLKRGSSSKKYTTSTTKTKVVKYDIPGIEDMVPSLWSPVKIEVRREDQQLYKFKEGDFPRLHLNDIEDMLLLLVQKKLLNLERDVIFDLGMALRMFTRCIVILRRVEDLQLGVESYQKKLNITKTETFRSDISNRIPYTAYNNPQGIIYVDKYNRNMLMRTDELYKFSDGTLTSVRIVLHDIASNLRMDYLPKRRWSNLDR
ncbi:hypothetical protein Tco_0291649 [Tanacetum coccineum]